MGLILRHRFALAGDIRFINDAVEKMETEQGFPVNRRINEVFSVIANGAEAATARITSNNLLGQIDDLYVAPDYRRQGLATYAIKGIEEFAFEKGLLRIKAVTQSNRASKVFEHCGYEPALEIPLGVTLKRHENFEGGPQYEITFLKELKL